MVISGAGGIPRSGVGGLGSMSRDPSPHVKHLSELSKGPTDHVVHCHSGRVVLRRPVRETHFSGLHGREAVPWFGGGCSCSSFSTGEGCRSRVLCSPNCSPNKQVVEGRCTHSVSALLLVSHVDQS